MANERDKKKHTEALARLRTFLSEVETDGFVWRFPYRCYDSDIVASVKAWLRSEIERGEQSLADLDKQP